MQRVYFRKAKGLLICFLIVELLTAPSVLAYDAAAVVAYAKQWKDQYNSSYANYTDGTGYEDANFVSQAFLAGNEFADVFTKEYWTDQNGCFIERSSFLEHLRNHEHVEVSSATTEIPSHLAPGDIIFFGDESNPLALTGVVTENNGGGDYTIAYHNPESGGIVGREVSLAELLLVYGGATYCHFPRPGETADKARFRGTGLYEGDGALSIYIIEPGENYEGYIVNNSDPSEQDMVIATNTSNTTDYKGCSYVISGFCCDQKKDAPSLGRTFGQPWTSNSKSHWAYWVRKAVTYANQNSVDSGLTQQAVWYITYGQERNSTVYASNPILKEIKFARGGPTKGEASFQNGSFESGTGPWLGNKLTTKDTRVCNTATDGACSFKIKGQKKKNKYLWQTVDISGSAGDLFTVKGSGKAKKAKRRGGSFGIELQIFHTDGSKQKCRSAFKSKKRKWQTKQKTCSAKEAYNQVAVFLRYGKQKGTAWFDNIQLTVPSALKAPMKIDDLPKVGLKAADKQRRLSEIRAIVSE